MTQAHAGSVPTELVSDPVSAPWLESVPASTPASADEAQFRMETSLSSSVTAPLSARVRPLTVAPVFDVMLVSAMILPWNAVVVPMVAELPTCQKTLQSFPPLTTRTEELLAVVSVLPIWKTKSASGSPCASSVSAPVSCADDEK